MDFKRKKGLPKVLLLYYTNVQVTRDSYNGDWYDSITNYPKFDVTSINISDSSAGKALRRNLISCDFIILLHSTNSNSLTRIKQLKSLLKERKTKLLSFVGNEVNLPNVYLEDKIKFLKDIQAEFIGTQLPLEAGKWLYSDCKNSRVIPLPHALNDCVFQEKIPLPGRKIHIGVRSAKYLPHLGDDDRNRLYEFFKTNKLAHQLVLDISTNSQDRLDRDGWVTFLNQCLGTLSNEAGTFYLQKDDATVKQIQNYIADKFKKSGGKMIKKNSISRKFWLKIPERVRSKLKILIKNASFELEECLYGSISFQEIYEQFYKNCPRPPVYTKAISSRHFDAIGTKTCQILLEGKYNDILSPGKHYLSLKSDFLNVEDVIAQFLDQDYRQQIVTQAFEYCMENHTYQNRMKSIYSLL